MTNKKKLAVAVAGTFFGSTLFLVDGYAAEKMAGKGGDALDNYRDRKSTRLNSSHGS